MLEVQPPTKRPTDVYPTVFLAGSIEMGAAVEWQKRVVEELKPLIGAVFNPRRKDWDSTWAQEASNTPFREQVTWELDAIDEADVIIFYFDPATKSPITLLELGLVLSNTVVDVQKVFVCCPNGFWRKGNVDITCERFGVQVYTDFDHMMKMVYAYVAGLVE